MDVGSGGGAARLRFRLDENVLRLHVAVDHVLLVQILQNVQHLRRVEGRQRQPEALAVRERHLVVEDRTDEILGAGPRQAQDAVACLRANMAALRGIGLLSPRSRAVLR